MTDDGGRMIWVPPGSAALIFPVPAISDDPDDDGSAIISEAALHHVVELHDDGEDG